MFGGVLKMPVAVYRRWSSKKVVLKEFCKFHMKTPVPESLFNKVAGTRTREHLQTTASYTPAAVQMFYEEDSIWKCLKNVRKVV